MISPLIPLLYERKRIVSRDPLKYISREGGRKLDIAGISFVTGAGESIFSGELAVAKSCQKYYLLHWLLYYFKTRLVRY